MRGRYARWTFVFLFALGGCASQGHTLGEGEGSTTQMSAACPPAGVEPLSGTTLGIAPSKRDRETIYCGRGDTYLLASPQLSNDCAADGFPCPYRR